jgi:nucleotide-binding universal stress UspA family protein
MKQILLPTDFSKNAWNALFMAVKLYADFECTFYVLNCYDLDMKYATGAKSTIRSGMVHKALKNTADKELDEVMQYIGENHQNPKHQFEKIAYSGDMVSGLKSTIAKYDIETVLMGTKGATGAKGVFLGSNTVKALKNIKNCVLITVPKKFEFKALKSVVLPTEYAHFFPKHIFKPLLELTDKQTQLKVFHVAQEFKLDEEQLANKKILKKRLQGYNYSFYNVTIDSTVAKAIRTFATEQKADFVVLTNYAHTFLEKLTQEPVVKKMAFKSRIPLMILPDFEG